MKGVDISIRSATTRQTQSMKNLLRLEEFAMFIVCVFLLAQHASPWWVFLLLAVGPDIGMIGYLLNNKVGAISYNIFHLKAVGISIFALGFFLQNETIQKSGLILFGHSSMDRMFGYGLKHFTGFQNTHLGGIGQTR